MKAETDIFELKPSFYARAVMKRWFRRYLWILAAVPVCCAAAAAAFNVAFVYVGLIALFIVYPSVMMMVYIGFATKPLALCQTVPHRVRAGDNGFTVEAVSDGERRWRLAPVEVPWRGVVSFDLSETMLTMVTGTDVGDIVLIPASAFGNDEAMSAIFLDLVHAKIRGK